MAKHVFSAVELLESAGVSLIENSQDTNKIVIVKLIYLGMIIKTAAVISTKCINSVSEYLTPATSTVWFIRYSLPQQPVTKPMATITKEPSSTPLIGARISSPVQYYSKMAKQKGTMDSRTEVSPLRLLPISL